MHEIPHAEDEATKSALIDEKKTDKKDKDEPSILPKRRNRSGIDTSSTSSTSTSSTSLTSQPSLDTLPSPGITFNDQGKPARLKVLSSGLEMIGDKGYRMIRASHGIREGRLYYELRMLKSNPVIVAGQTTVPHVRLGFATAEADVQAPVGYDLFGYSIRDIDGKRFTHAAPQVYGVGWKEGDIIGCYIDLPKDTQLELFISAQDGSFTPRVPTNNSLENTHGKKKKGRGSSSASHTNGGLTPTSAPNSLQLYPSPSSLLLPFEEVTRRQRFHVGSRIVFFKNGKCMGTAFNDLIRGTEPYCSYFPAVSLYMGCRVEVNFGPNW